ncbi:MAG: preprotein translocase subunit YajC [Gemmatimonadetes bacterium]|nr:preprotein translocase subunit YajC [Gemmatimonadota bacterium]
MIFVFQMAAIIAIFYFLIIRPKVQQERKHRDRPQQLKRGDEAVTAGGLVGEVIHLKDDRVTLKTGEARVVVQRDRIAEIRTPKVAEEEKKPS